MKLSTGQTVGEVTDLRAPLSVRAAVFIAEQGVDPAIDVDGMDAECLHWLATDTKGAVATLRVLPKGDLAKIQRVAVLKRARGTGVGMALMKYVLTQLAERGFTRATLGAQTGALGFYERLGFVAHGPIYDDAGIPHRDMDRNL